MWQPSYQAGEPDKILGYPVNTSAFAPEKAIAFGDYSYYNIGDRGTRSISELRELFAGNGMMSAWTENGIAFEETEKGKVSFSQQIASELVLIEAEKQEKIKSLNMGYREKRRYADGSKKVLC